MNTHQESSTITNPLLLLFRHLPPATYTCAPACALRTALMWDPYVNVILLPMGAQGFIELMGMMQSRRKVIWQGRVEMLSKAVPHPPFMKEF